MSDRILQGDAVSLEVTFTDALGNVGDPSTVRFVIQRTGPQPADPEIIYLFGKDDEVVRIAAGVYAVDFVVTGGGIWSWRFEGTGVIQKAEQGNFYAFPAVPS